MQPHQRDFLDLALHKQVLRFGEFTLKSGRTSPPSRRPRSAQGWRLVTWRSAVSKAARPKARNQRLTAA